jgi:putative Mg2+ transporter-C (MgtC) family protein
MNIYMIYTLRLIIATIIGALIGLDKGVRGRIIGIKTYSLVCLGSCLVSAICMIMTNEIEPTTFGRVAGSIVVSLGFLGAGVILVTKDYQIKGLTTAASIWFTSCLGLVIGTDYYWLAIPAVICYFIVFVLFSKIEDIYKRDEDEDEDKK